MQNLPSYDDIPPEYLQILEQKYSDAISGAATDADILTVLDQLLERTHSGMVWDESGEEQFLSVNEAAYWDSPQIVTEADLAGGGNGEPSKAMQIGSAVVFLVVLLFATWYLFVGRHRNDQPVAEAGEIVATAEENSADESPPMAIGDELGARVQIGQPASLEIRPYSGVEGIAFTVVNAPVAGRQMPILEVMRSDEMVAEWVLGTVVNQVYGIPPMWIDQVEIGSQILVRTDTGAVYYFICTEKTLISEQQNEQFSQNKPGLTLFPLPAYETPITVIWCPYDPEYEQDSIAGGLASSIGESVEAGNVNFVVDTWHINEGLDGQLYLDIYGRIQAAEGDYGSVVLSLNTPKGKYSPTGDQYQAAAQESTWLAQFVLPKTAVGTLLQLEARSPLGGAALVELGELPDLQNFVEATVTDALWNEQTRTITTKIFLTNTHSNSSIVITSDMFTANQNQGGDNVNVGIRVLEPDLPYQLQAGERVSFVVNLTPSNFNNIDLSILNAVWEVQVIPTN